MGRSAAAIDSRWESPMQAMHRAGSRVIARGARMQRSPGSILLADVRVSNPDPPFCGALVRVASNSEAGQPGLARVMPRLPTVDACFSPLASGKTCMFPVGTCMISWGTCMFCTDQPWGDGFQSCSSGKDACFSGKQTCSDAKHGSNRREIAGIPLLMREAPRFKREARRNTREILKNTREMIKKNLGISGPQTPVDRAQACPAKHPDGYIEALF